MQGEPIIPGVKGSQWEKKIAAKAEGKSVKKGMSGHAMDYLNLMEEDDLLPNTSISTHSHTDHILKWVAL